MKSLFFISTFFYAISVPACFPQTILLRGPKVPSPFSPTEIMAAKALFYSKGSKGPVGFKPKNNVTEQNKALRKKVEEQKALIKLLQRKIALDRYRLNPADRRIFLPTVS